jgi:hypothetical protein
MTGATEQEIQGALFGTIQYANETSLGVFLDNLKKEQALLIISEALKYGYERGLYDLKESESISKSLRIISTE